MTTLRYDPDQIERLQAGDRDAWRMLFADCGPVLLGYATRMLNSRSLAEDVVPDALVSAYRHIGSYDGRASLKTWLCRIVRNRAIDELRRSSRFVGLPEDDPEGSYFTEAGKWVAGCPRWEERIDAARKLHEVRDALDQLPHSWREVLLLKEVHGFSTDEICESLEIQPGNLRIRLHRARKALRAAVVDGPKGA